MTVMTPEKRPSGILHHWTTASRTQDKVPATSIQYERRLRSDRTYRAHPIGTSRIPPPTDMASRLHHARTLRDPSHMTKSRSVSGGKRNDCGQRCGTAGDEWARKKPTERMAARQLRLLRVFCFEHVAHAVEQLHVALLRVLPERRDEGPRHGARGLRGDGCVGAVARGCQ